MGGGRTWLDSRSRHSLVPIDVSLYHTFDCYEVQFGFASVLVLVACFFSRLHISSDVDKRMPVVCLMQTLVYDIVPCADCCHRLRRRNTALVN